MYLSVVTIQVLLCLYGRVYTSTLSAYNEVEHCIQVYLYIQYGTLIIIRVQYTSVPSSTVYEEGVQT